MIKSLKDRIAAKRSPLLAMRDKPHRKPKDCMHCDFAPLLPATCLIES
jgi:hypothetical protein